jgi:RIO kinase 1
MKKKRLEEFDRELDKLRMKEKDSEWFKVFAEVFDSFTLKSLYKLKKRHNLEMGGVVNTGKEAHVFIGKVDDRDVAVKIYMITTSNFRAMADYILGDHRFSNVRKTKRDIILAWAQKEYKNLKRAKNADVDVPEPYDVYKNILIMEFLGKNGVPFPTLKECELMENFTKKDMAFAIEQIIDNMTRLYKDAELVHADLSEYNVLWDSETKKVFIIDMGQGVTLEHPNAEMFLLRDVKNIVRLAKKHGLKYDAESVLSKVKGYD